MDDVFLNAPSGILLLGTATAFNIGSYLEKGEQIDYGTAGLIRPVYVTNAFVDGARLSREDRSGIRKMRFPIMVPSGAASITDPVVGVRDLDSMEGVLRSMARPGGWLDIKPAGAGLVAASSDNPMIRFDILGGQVVHNGWSIDQQRVSRRRLVLEIDTQPFGYWPTWITLQTAASISMAGAGRMTMLFPGLDAVYGDVPGLCEITVVPTVATQTASHGAFGGLTPYQVDGLAWSNGARASFLPVLSGGSLGNWTHGGTTGTFAPAGSAGAAATLDGTATVSVISVPPGVPSYIIPWFYRVDAAVAPAYFGRFRVYAAVTDLAARPHALSVDVVPDVVNSLSMYTALASANRVATMAPTAMNGWQICDLGEITLPPAGLPSNSPSTYFIRCWANRASNAATSQFYTAGMYLQPLDGEAGVLTAGMAWPSIGVATQFQTQLGVTLRSDTVYNQGGDLRRLYTGELPFIGATPGKAGHIGPISLDFLALQRSPAAASSTVPPLIGTRAFASVTLKYQPRFTFQRYI